MKFNKKTRDFGTVFVKKKLKFKWEFTTLRTRTYERKY